MENKNPFINILFGTLWNWVIGGIMNILGFIQLFTDMPILNRVPWYGWVIIGIIVWIIGIAFNYHKFIKESENSQSANKDINEIKNKPNCYIKKKIKKTLKKVSAHVKHNDDRIYVLIENKECRIDINCTNITVYKVNSLDSNHTISYSDIEDAFNSFFALGDKVLTPYARIKDVIIPVNHKDKNELDLLTINSSENQLEFKTIAPRNPLNPGLYRLVLGFTVYPQKEGYKDFDIYITARIDYHGGSDLELLELRNARTKE